VYRSERLRLYSTVGASVARLWANDYQDEERTIASALSLVAAGQARTVSLVDAYMSAKTREVTGRGGLKGLDPKRYTVDALRGAPAREVYQRPFGALGAFIATRGQDGWAAGMAAATGSLIRLAQTDLQLAQTHSARDWMAEDKYVRGYRRMLGGGENCDLCKDAARNFYHREDLAPIHERCGCTVSPVYGEPGPLERAALHTKTCRVTDDSEIGPRLMAPGWTG
jgi:hypothetical protein